MILDNMKKQNLILVLIAILIIIIPLVFMGGSDFEGADDQAEDVIVEVAPDYEPWAEPLWEPPSGEVESLLFSVQVAIGAIFIGYMFGVLRERNKHVTNR